MSFLHASHPPLARKPVISFKAIGTGVLCTFFALYQLPARFSDAQATGNQRLAEKVRKQITRYEGQRK